ncbi:MAG: hypothetical protein IJS08_16230, partial [Victivallales bacterium]|nr:hypothetical protein [Victivallales bacterium]
ARLLVSCFKAPGLTFIINAPGYSTCQIKSITSGNDDYDVCHSLVRSEDGFVFNFDTDDSAVFQLEFAK